MLKLHLLYSITPYGSPDQRRAACRLLQSRGVFWGLHLLVAAATQLEYMDAVASPPTSNTALHN
jgi:hypothetical protein